LKPQTIEEKDMNARTASIIKPVLFMGPMCSDKSAELILTYMRGVEQGKRVLVVKPARDGRTLKLWSRRPDLPDVDCIAVQDFAHIAQLVCEHQPDVLIIDEIFMLPEPFERDLLQLQMEFPDLLVYMASLVRDFRGLPFEITRLLVDFYQQNQVPIRVVATNSAKCSVCHNPATQSQRLLNGAIVPWDSDLIEPGADQYEPRCDDCFVIPPGRPPDFKMPIWAY